jgi:hypothetical protein
MIVNMETLSAPFLRYAKHFNRPTSPHIIVPAPSERMLL